MQLFYACQNRWNQGFDGPTGLILTDVKAMAEIMELDFAFVWPLMSHLETAWLQMIREKIESSRKKPAQQGPEKKAKRG